MSKGDGSRPMEIPREVFNGNHDRAFKNKSTFCKHHVHPEMICPRCEKEIIKENNKN